MRFGNGRGFGGGGRGWRRWFYATGQPGWMRFGALASPYGYPSPYNEYNPETEKQMLQNQAEALQSELEVINKRLEEIRSKTSTE
jgi:hypothetical protein